ncbi:MAG: hypothetical protein FJ399_18000, partial [Verrucomicrobia bacterium]|nr:hypothetical protein [Verrucomicrobiota bacterium]
MSWDGAMVSNWDVPNIAGPVQAEARMSLRGILRQLGPGAIIASLTIGSGELVFSSRAGALFGYQVLGLFVLVLALKWALVFASATHWVNTDRHPFQRWVDLPGPRGWLPVTFFLLAVISFPVWVSFHAGTIGTLLASLTNTTGALRGTGALWWAVVTLLLTMVLSATGTYARQEKLQ